MEIGKRGPKTDNPKTYKITIKLDQSTKNVLDDYCKQKAVSISESARRGIKKLEDDLEK